MNSKMKFSLICLLFIVLASNSFAEVDLTHLIKNIRPAVVTVITYDKGKNPLGQGSGFFIDANGHLITNYHVLTGASHAEVRTYDGKRYPIKSVIGENKKMDLIKALVDIPRSSVQWLEATGTLPSLAERVVVVGSPMGHDFGQRYSKKGFPADIEFGVTCTDLLNRYELKLSRLDGTY